MFHETKNTGIRCLMFAKSFVIEKYIEYFILIKGIHPSYKFFSRQWVFIPTSIREAESYIIAHFKIAHKHFQSWINGINVQEVGRFPAQNMSCTLSHHRLIA